MMLSPTMEQQWSSSLGTNSLEETQHGVQRQSSDWGRGGNGWVGAEILVLWGGGLPWLHVHKKCSGGLTEGGGGAINPWRTGGGNDF